MDFYDAREKLKTSAFAYLRTILRNKVYDYYHKSQKLPILFSNNEAYIDQQVAPSVLEVVYNRETSSVISQQIKMLPEQCRNVFLLSRLEELSNKEIAERLGISIKTVEGHITKALKYLREHVEYNWAWWVVLFGWTTLK